MDNNFGRIYFTADLPGTGGRLKERPEDFIVEEVPLYEFS
ncbi:MAG: tRNA pseudouridine(13) synthase TruD, partial [Deltaproteobacteria bacterium]